MTTQRQGRVAFIGAGGVEYPRNRILYDGLRAQGMSVDVYLQPKRTSTRQRLAHVWRTLPTLRDYDAVLLIAFNQTSVPLARFLARRYGVKLVVDYLVGLSDMNEDRGLVSYSRQHLYRALDAWNLRHTPTLTDTPEHIAYYAEMLKDTPEGLFAVPVGVRDSFLRAQLTAPDAHRVTVQYLGTYIPFHGVETILEGADLLRDEPRINFELIGEGQTLGAMQALARRLNLSNVRFITGYHRPPDVYEHLSRAHVFLGVLGASAKTDYVVPTKIFELASLGRPIITAQSSALRSAFPEASLYTIAPGDAHALARAIRTLADDATLRDRLARNARAHIEAHYTSDHIGAQLRRIVLGDVHP